MNQRTKLRKLLEEERRLSAQIHALRIADYAEERLRRGREQGDPLASVKALVAAQRALHMLATGGYPLLLPLLWEIQIGVDEIKRLYVRELVRRILLYQVPEPRVDEACALLQELAESGRWPEAKDDLDDVEARLNETDALLQSARA